MTGTGRPDEVRVPAVFHGTARLTGPDDPPPASGPARHDDLVGQFVADLELDHALLLQAGLVPVHPSHPAHAHHLAALAAPPAVSMPHDPAPFGADTVRFPFSTTIMVTPEMALRHGLTTPGSSATLAPSAPVLRRPPPPPSPPPSLPPIGQPDPAAGPGLMRQLARLHAVPPAIVPGRIRSGHAGPATTRRTTSASGPDHRTPIHDAQ